jgi:predicted DNA-binding protein
MSITTIKVDTEVRDRLAALAKKRGETMGVLLRELLRKAEREARWAEVRLAYEHLRADAQEWQAYQAEIGWWTEGSDGGFWADHDAARDDWPEYHQAGVVPEPSPFAERDRG